MQIRTVLTGETGHEGDGADGRTFHAFYAINCAVFILLGAQWISKHVYTSLRTYIYLPPKKMVDVLVDLRITVSHDVLIDALQHSIRRVAGAPHRVLVRHA